MRTGALLVLALTTVVAACGSRTITAKRPTASTPRGTPYRLYTHCGIEWARINGTYWRAKPPLSDGSGNPPPGWGNPFQEGTLARTSSSTARFNSPAGSVTFQRTTRTRPPVICS
jgi:hypothetical protein